VARGVGANGELRVLDLTDELAFQASRLLVGLGADVLRPVVGSLATTSALDELHWHAGKRYVQVDHDVEAALDALAAQADVVIESGRRAQLRGVRSSGEQLTSRWPDLVHVVVTPFGLTGPRRDWAADDLVIGAAGGMAWLCGRADGPPKAPPREQAVQLAGAHAAIAALLGVLAADRDGEGQLVDISAQEAVAATLETGAIAWIHARRYPSRNGGVYEHVAHRIFPTADGYVAGGYSGSNRMWTDLLAWLDEVGEAADLTDPQWSDPQHRWAGRAHVDDVLTSFTRSRTARDIAAEARRRALPWAEVAGPAELLTNPQLAAREFLTTIERPGGPLLDVGFPIETTGAPRPVHLNPPQAATTAKLWRTTRRRKRVGRPAVDAPGRPALAGLRVLDLTWVLAGPYATKILAEHGADVIKVESRHRHDPTRFSPSMRLRAGAGPDDGGYFLNFNHDKRSVAINLRTPQGQELLRRLAAQCDVVIDNFRPGVLARWGISYEQLEQTKPAVVVVSMAGTGETGPWRDVVTFADTLAAMSGLTHETRDPGGPPQGLTFGLGDMIAANAAVLGVLDLLASGRGGRIDLSQLEAMASNMGTAVLEAQLGAPQEWATPGWPNRNPQRIPHGTYPTRGDDRWIAISAADDAAWRNLVTLSESPELKALVDSTLEQRRAHQDQIDAALATWSSRLDGAELTRCLQRVGVAAATVNNGADLVESDEQLRHRVFYKMLTHPIAGACLHEGPVAHLQRTPPRIDRPAPLLGEHTSEVLGELLAMSQQDVVALEQSGVLE
jgi:crotonobetainyl-CoA:carnitine CoA-transferase CaiB-like acyl-CoA transferase